MGESPSGDSNGNALFDRLPKDVLRRLVKKAKRVSLNPSDVLYEARGSIEFSYFPIDCVLSAVTVMRDGSAIEVATVGREGAVGLPSLLDADTSPNRVFAQIGGSALRIENRMLKEEAARDESLGKLLARYHAVFLTQVSQSVACNGLHTLPQRCFRWLLLTHDRVDGDEVALTHEFLAIMLGVRRAGVSEVLQALRDDGLIRYGRGRIQVLDRPGLEAKSCECYQNVNEEYDRLLG